MSIRCGVRVDKSVVEEGLCVTEGRSALTSIDPEADRMYLRTMSGNVWLKPHTRDVDDGIRVQLAV